MYEPDGLVSIKRTVVNQSLNINKNTISYFIVFVYFYRAQSLRYQNTRH